MAPLPIPTKPNQRVHVDLYGPLKSSGNNKHVLCMTDAFYKIAVVVPIPDKEASKVGANDPGSLDLLIRSTNTNPVG